jgi:hypothetical protein
MMGAQADTKLIAPQRLQEPANAWAGSSVRCYFSHSPGRGTHNFGPVLPILALSNPVVLLYNFYYCC